MWQSMGLHRVGHGLATKQQKLTLDLPSVQFSSVAQSCLTLCNSMNRSTPPFKIILGFPGNLVGKESTCNTGDLGLIPGSGRPLEKEMATHSSTLAWEIPWTEEPGGLQSMGSQRARRDLVTKPPVNPTDAQPSNNQLLNHHLAQDSCSNL